MPATKCCCNIIAIAATLEPYQGQSQYGHVKTHTQIMSRPTPDGGISIWLFKIHIQTMSATKCCCNDQQCCGDGALDKRRYHWTNHNHMTQAAACGDPQVSLVPAISQLSSVKCIPPDPKAKTSSSGAAPHLIHWLQKTCGD
jgi:hypothetical protein